MEPVEFDLFETYEPDEGWHRVTLAGSDQFTFEWFGKPPGRSFDFWTDRDDYTVRHKKFHRSVAVSRSVRRFFPG